MDVGAESIAELSDFVDESDFGRQERVGGVFDELGRFDVGDHEWSLEQIKGRVNILHDGHSLSIAGADDDPVGSHKVGDCGAFAKELWIGDNRERMSFGFALGNDFLDELPGANRHSGFGDHHLVPIEVIGDRLGDLDNVREVGGAIFFRRSADRNENSEGLLDSRGEVSGKVKAPGPGIFFHQRVQPGLVDRNLAVEEFRDLLLVFVDAGHVDAEISKTGPGDEPNVAGTNNADMHECSLVATTSRQIMLANEE